MRPGTLLEFLYKREYASAHPSSEGPARQKSSEERTMARINKVGHVVLNVQDVETSVKFYTEALGMEVMRLREGNAAFLSFGTQHHDIALFKATEGAEMGKLGLNHIAFQI